MLRQSEIAVTKVFRSIRSDYLGRDLGKMVFLWEVEDGGVPKLLSTYCTSIYFLNVYARAFGQCNYCV